MNGSTLTVVEKTSYIKNSQWLNSYNFMESHACRTEIIRPSRLSGVAMRGERHRGRHGQKPPAACIGAISKMKGGGHGQANIDFLNANGIEYNIVMEYPNGVRVGNVPSHKVKAKRTGTN